MNLEEYKGVYIFAEQVDGKVSNIAYELIGEGKNLAEKLNTEVTAVLIGSGVKGEAEKLGAYGADRVILVDDPERRIALALGVGDVGPEPPEGVDQEADGALTHAGAACQQAGVAGPGGEVGGEETHSGTGGADVDGLVCRPKRMLQGAAVVAVGQVDEGRGLGGECAEYRDAIADALRGGQRDGGLQAVGGFEVVLHRGYRG